MALQQCYYDQIRCLFTQYVDDGTFNAVALQLLANLSQNSEVPTSSTVTTEATIAVGITSTSVLAANPNRVRAYAKNISDSDIYVSLSGTASLSKPTLVSSGETLQISGAGGIYTGPVSAITAVGTKSLEVVEF